MTEYTSLDMFIRFLETLKNKCEHNKNCEKCEFIDWGYGGCMLERIPQNYDIEDMRKALYRGGD